MSDPITLEDIYKLFEKTNERFEQSRREYDRRFAEIAEAEAQRRAETEAEAQRRREKMDRRFVQMKTEADHSVAELKKTVANTTKAVEGLTTRWGRFVEELVEPAVNRLFRERGVDQYAYKQGLFVIKPSGETVEIINDAGFQAKLW